MIGFALLRKYRRCRAVRTVGFLHRVLMFPACWVLSVDVQYSMYVRKRLYRYLYRRVGVLWGTVRYRTGSTYTCNQRSEFHQHAGLVPPPRGASTGYRCRLWYRYRTIVAQSPQIFLAPPLRDSRARSQTHPRVPQTTRTTQATNFGKAILLLLGKKGEDCWSLISPSHARPSKIRNGYFHIQPTDSRTPT